MHLIVNCPRNSKIALKCEMDQNSQNIVWINNSRTAWPTYILIFVFCLFVCLFFKFLGQFTICDVIKQNQSEVGNIDFKKEPNKAENVFCFLLFLASFNCSYLWNQLTNFNWIFCKI